VTATPLLPCPTPYKDAYRSRGLALAGFVVGPATRARHAYLCRCGYGHIASNDPWQCTGP
jgi:hypothetical protein